MATELNNQPEIFQLLEKSNSIFDNFQRDNTVVFEFEKLFYVVFYNHKKNILKAFVCELSIAELKELIALVQNTADISREQEVIALKTIENKIASLSLSSFFDAH